MDVATSLAIETAVKHVVEKIKRGKRLTAEDILILQLGTITGELRAIRVEAAEREKAVREEIVQLRGEVSQLRGEVAQLRGDVYTKIDEFRKEVNTRFDNVYAEMSRRFDATDAKIDELRKEMNARFDALHAEINRRFDELYRLLTTTLAQKRQES